MNPSREQAEDVESYVRARWVDAVSALVELGAGVEEAERAARTAMVRSWRRWDRARRSGDADELVFGELLRAWGWPERRLDVGADRVARVLMVQARLSDWVAERLTEADPGDAPLATWAPDDDGAYRGAAPLDEIRDDLRHRRRRTATLVAAGAAGVLAAAALVGVVLVIGADDAPPERRPEVANPLPLAWWSAGTLHLGSSELAVPGLAALAQAGGGASYVVVFGDEDGRVLQVGDAGDPEQIGESVGGAQIIASSDGRVAWVDVGARLATVVVWDTERREVVDRLTLPDAATGLRTEVVALDGDTVHLRSPVGTSRWVLGQAQAEPVRDRVLDAANGVLLVQAPSADSSIPIRSVSGAFEVRADHQATLSPGGLVAAAWVPNEPDLTLAGAGATLTTVPLDLPRRSGILDASFAPDGALVLVLVADLGAPGQGGGGRSGERPAPRTIATCVLQTGTCEVSVSLDGPGPDARSAHATDVVLAR